MKKTIFPTEKPYWKSTGESGLYIPIDTKWGGDNRELKLVESFYLIAIETAGDDKELFKKLTTNRGKPISRTTDWRIRKSLKKKGYL